MPDFETYLTALLEQRAPSKVKDAMMYSLLNGGKRVRPNLLFATLQAYGIKEEKGYAAAAAIEMIHTYSLIHDDLPAMDDDTLRRGKPTCHVAFDEATAILAGDGLLTLAFEVAATAGDDAKTSLSIVSECAKSAGMEGMILGQAKDLAAEGMHLSQESALQEIHIYKTGKLLTLPMVCGALLAQRQSDLETWRNIGTLIGISFQIQDDVLDVISTNEALGKNVGSDAAQEKSTYVNIMGIDEASKKAELLFQDATALLRTMNIHKEPMETYFTNLIHRKK